ncbi:MAG: TlpA family protein disulfide reductase [Candidatus Sulfotelmatobacter sp.]
MGRTAWRRLCLIFALSTVVLNAGCFERSRPHRIGEVAPDFTVQDSDKKVTLSQFRGQVVLVNFWATWCPPCVEELPSLMYLQERLRSRGVTVLGISIDVDGDAYHRFIAQHSVNFLTVRDPEQKVSSVYGTTGWPETYIVDRQGVLRRKVVGPTNWNSPEMVEFLEKQ